ncbi:MAG: hypothetical protein IPI80_00230 [Burkholderiales bacterium]|nr:hypothetical protein [Burkholderiales bacterium]
MTPMFGIVFGAWLLNEPIEPNFLIGAIPVLLGIVLVSGGRWLDNVVCAFQRLYSPLKTVAFPWCWVPCCCARPCWPLLKYLARAAHF